MNFEEHAAKPLLQAAGIAVPRGQRARSAGEAEAVAAGLGVPVVVKAQVPAGKRGKAGGIRAADDPRTAHDAAKAILGMEIAGHRVAAVLVDTWEGAVIRMKIERSLAPLDNCLKHVLDNYFRP